MEQTGTVMAVCVSTAKGTPKENVGRAMLVEDWGLQGDAHAGKWHRQVSLLSCEKVEAFRARGAEVADGAFGENLLVSGIDLRTLPLGTRLHCGGTVLEVTQIGKECHQGCAIFQKMGDCIMPREGIFARVLRGGEISVGDTLTVEGGKRMYRAIVITASDKGWAGEREDRSGPLAAELLAQAGYQVVETVLLPDDRGELSRTMAAIADGGRADLIVTTGGTGFSPRDCTPEATLDVAERLVPGIAEAMRWHSLQITPRAMLSRAVSAIRRGALIVNLPGSPKGVRECLEYILPSLEHGLDILRGEASNCAR